MNTTSDQPPRVRLADVEVGTGEPVLIIAEAGINHDGQVDDALRLIDAAAAAGADAVKFQIFRAAELVSRRASTATYQQQGGAGDSQLELLTRLELSDAELTRLAQHCAACKLVLLATPFGEADVDRVCALGAPAIKLASTDIDNVPLLRRVAATQLPLIVSTGAADHVEVARAVDLLTDCGARHRLVLLHCVSSYPTPLDAANLRAIQTLLAAFAVPVGYSDHTTGTQTGALAVAAGACVLEKHLTLDRHRPGPDHAMSLTPAQLREYVVQVRRAEAALGSGMLSVADLEQDVRRVARKSVVAARPIDADTPLDATMLTIKRPGGGIPPAALDQLIGRRLTVAVQADDVITWDLVQ